jgi:hypothetical protein
MRLPMPLAGGHGRLSAAARESLEIVAELLSSCDILFAHLKKWHGRVGQKTHHGQLNRFAVGFVVNGQGQLCSRSEWAVGQNPLARRPSQQACTRRAETSP